MDTRIYLFFYNKGGRHWHRLPREAVAAQILKASKIRLYRALRIVIIQ